jgi:HlyD family secretion protein
VKVENKFIIMKERGSRLIKLTAIILSLCAIVLMSFACASGSGTTTTVKTQISTVQKGDIAVTVTGTGNLALARSEDLAFEIAGTVAEVLVAESDSVSEGQELAKLDTSEWDSQIKTLEKNLETAKRNLTTKESDSTKTQRQIATMEMAVKTAEMEVESAENNITNIEDVKVAQDEIDKINSDLTFAKQMRQASTVDSLMRGDTSYWNLQINDLNTRLTAAEKELQDILDETSVNITTNVALQISSAQLQVEQKKKALEDAKTAVEDANENVADAYQVVTDAEQAVKDAHSDLDEAKSLSPIIKAPFAGFITKVNVIGGDEVWKGTVALQLADPNQFKAVILVTEKDVFSVKVGGEATVSLDALNGVSFPARITAVSPTATVTSGVVNYKVTVELTSLTPTGNTATSATRTPTMTSATAQTVSLKDGLSAVVDILVQGKNGVLMVPSRAITRQGANSVVQVVKGTVTETRIVKTGMSDETNTEITEGLSEGEQVLITLSGSSSSTTSNSGPGGLGGIAGPGGPGGILR